MLGDQPVVQGGKVGQVAVPGHPVLNRLPVCLSPSALSRASVDGARGNAPEMIADRALAQVQLPCDDAVGLAFAASVLMVMRSSTRPALAIEIDGGRGYATERMCVNLGVALCAD